MEKPQAPDVVTDPISWIIVDEVIYFDDQPWLTGSDGTGQVLQRINPDQSGNAPTNWSNALLLAGFRLI